MQSAADVIHVTHEPSEQKEAATKQAHKTYEQDEGNANDYAHHEEENSGAQRHPKEGTPVPPATPATPAPPMTTLATPVTPASMLVTPASSVNTSAGVKRRRETQSTHERKFANRIFSSGNVDEAIGGIRAHP